MTLPDDTDVDLAEWLLRLLAFTQEIDQLDIPITTTVTLEQRTFTRPVRLAVYRNEAAERLEGQRQGGGDHEERKEDK